MTELRSSKCRDCGRTTYETGPHYSIEGARDRDGREQGWDFLESLRLGKKTLVPRIRLGRSEEQDLYADLLVRFEDYCHTGQLQVPRQLNHLRDDLWEIKAGRARMPFFRLAHSPSRAVRLTHGFIKGTEKCPRNEIDKGLAIQREDMKHERV